MMKQTIRITTFLLAATFGVGCNSEKNASSAQADNAESARQQGEKAKEASVEVAHAIEKYGYARREQFVLAMKKQLANFQADIDQLSKEIESSSGEVKAQAQLKLEAVRRKWDETSKELEKAQTATAENWDAAEDKFRTASSDLKSNVDEARTWLANKIKPS